MNCTPEEAARWTRQIAKLDFPRHTIILTSISGTCVRLQHEETGRVADIAYCDLNALRRVSVKKGYHDIPLSTEANDAFVMIGRRLDDEASATSTTIVVNKLDEFSGVVSGPIIGRATDQIKREK